MEMMVWQLRRDGEKLTEESLDGPYRGWLRLGRLNIAGQITLSAGLYASKSPGAPPILHRLSDVEVRSLDERGLLLYGLQTDPYAQAPKVAHRQAWACKLAP